MTELHGACACERNQYTILIPSTSTSIPSSTSLAEVFFDNTSSNRRLQATPLTAWLRIPLSWYHSSTTAYFPDESHASIKRTFHAPAPSQSQTRVRKQFCGYCGSHLSAWSEVEGEGGWLDVTLGSLWGESLGMLEALGLVPESDDDDEGEDEEGNGGGLVKGGTVQEEEHIPVADGDGMSGIEADTDLRATDRVAGTRMQGRGMPYFETMVESSRLGRIKRQKGGHTSHNGRMRVQWEVVEIGGSEEVASGEDMSEAIEREVSSKRQKTGA